MRKNYEARWVSRQRYDALRRSGRLGDILLLETTNGYLVIQPSGSDAGDGAALRPQEADYELQAVWFPGPPPLLKKARALLGLETDACSPRVAETSR